MTVIPQLIAASGTNSSIDFTMLFIQLFGGLAMFLFGMDMLAAAMRVVAGEKMKWILAKLTNNRFMGVLSGFMVTGVLQSSSVTTVLLVGFVSAGLMTLPQSIGVILGANIGTTLTGQIIAFKVTKFALVGVAVGYALIMFGRKDVIKQYGKLIVGLGLLFVGMTIMSDGMKPLRGSEAFLEIMGSLSHPIWGLLIGAAFTALVQSSSVTTGIVITMAMAKLLDLDTGIAIILGANIGTCVTAMLASIGKPREAVRAAMVHVLFNVIGALLWIGFIPQLSWMVNQVGGDLPRQVANAQTLFNVANTLIFLPFVGPLAWLVQKMIPLRVDDQPDEDDLNPIALNDELLETPVFAMVAAQREIAHLGAGVQRYLDRAMPVVLTGSLEDLDDLVDKDNPIDDLHARIVKYLNQINQNEMPERETRRVTDLMSIASGFEHIGDVVEHGLIELGRKRIAQDFEISEQTRTLINQAHAQVSEAMGKAILAIKEDQRSFAKEARQMKSTIKELQAQARVHQAQRLNADAPKRLETYAMETDVMENLRRIYDYTRRLSKLI